MNLYDSIIYEAIAGSGGGGGGGSAKPGVLRGDAELVQKWTYDKLAVADEGYTIPSYTTSEQTVKASEDVSVPIADGYDYYFTVRMMAYPVYNNASVAKGRQEVFISSFSAESVRIPKEEFEADNGTKVNGQESFNTVYTNSQYRDVYWSSSSDLIASNALMNGATMRIPNSSAYISNGSYVFKTPACYLSGSNTVFNSTYWGYMTDIRFQYIAELYRVPTSAEVRGYAVTSNLAHANNCWKSDSKTLT